MDDDARILEPMRRILIVLIFCPWVIAAAEGSGDVLSGLRAGHPRLLFTDKQLAAALADAKIDPLRAQLHKRIIALAEEEHGSQPVKRVLIGSHLLEQSHSHPTAELAAMQVIAAEEA